jgi:adenylate cyclase class IV
VNVLTRKIMQTEIEAKFLNIDVEKTRAKLQEIGAILEYPERLMKRTTYDLKNKSLRKEKAWVRVRDEGSGKITLSYKKLVDRSIYGTKEITVDVSSFETICNFLEACGFESKSYVHI